MGHNLEILQGREGDSHNANVAQPVSENTYATSKATRTSDSVKCRSTNQVPLRLSSHGLRRKPLNVDSFLYLVLYITTVDGGFPLITPLVNRYFAKRALLSLLRGAAVIRAPWEGE